MKTANEYLSREALISKLEACQQQLAEAWGRIDIEVSLESEIADLRAQLAEAQAEVERLQAQAETLARLSEIPIFSSHDRDGVIE